MEGEVDFSSYRRELTMRPGVIRLIDVLKMKLDRKKEEDKLIFSDIGVESFDWVTAVNNTSGTIVEVGGPSPKWYESLGIGDIRQFGDRVVVTNIYEEVTSDRFTVDKLMDARHIKYPDNSVGAIFAGALPKDVREEFLLEAQKKLKDGGLLVLGSFDPHDLVWAKAMGFEVKRLERKDKAYPQLQQNGQTYFAVLERKSEFPIQKDARV